MYYVTRYETTRHYGGPEEGGWWYDWHANPVQVAAHADEDAASADCCQRNAAQRNDQVGQGRFSVLGGADYTYHVETTVGEDATTHRPHYE